MHTSSLNSPNIVPFVRESLGLIFRFVRVGVSEFLSMFLDKPQGIELEAGPGSIIIQNTNFFYYLIFVVHWHGNLRND